MATLVETQPVVRTRWWLPSNRAALAVAVAVVLYSAVFGVLTWRQQSNFGQYAFDMGIYDQSIWLLSRGRVPFSTVRGLNYFGHHMNPITVLFVPFYWVGAGGHFLLVAQTLALALGAVPIFLIGRHILGQDLPAAVIAIAYLLHPTIEWINWWNFHPDAFMVLPLLCCWLFARRGQWRWFAVSVVAALACKEDAAPAVVMMGLLVAIFWKRWVGIATAIAGASWFWLATKVIIPHANGGLGPFYDQLFPTLGTTSDQIVRNALVHPSRVWHLLSERHRLSYYWHILAPAGCVSLLALPILLIAAPQTVINGMSNSGYPYNAHYHYSAILVAAVFIAALEACAFWARHRPGLLGLLSGLVLASAMVSNVAWSPSPLGSPPPGTWAKVSARSEAADRAVRLIPAGAGVSASSAVVTHLAHRTHIYEWPNPWVLGNWGINSERPPNTGTVDWIVLDTPPAKSQTVLYTYLTQAGGEFTVVFSEAGVVVAKRVNPPTIQQVLPPPPD